MANSAQIRERLARRRRTRLPHLEDMRQTPAVVVLGERGCGKSVALEQEHAQLDAAGVPVTFLHLGRDVFDVTSAATRLEQALCTGLEVGTRFLLLDGLDEGLSDIPGLE
ncbi:hypothetical protein [Streptomyces pseudogriseolus]|uniref:hypothetical protein n=1 Tax=Streptomyces pseudogriseolus TaxID=36817 RepID=UPI003FA1F810